MKQWLEHQYQNKFLYVPFLLSAGAGVYFTLAHEPQIPCLYLTCLGLGVAMFIPKIPVAIRAVIIAMFGFVYACTFANLIDTPQMKHNLYDHDIRGEVKLIDYTDDGARVYVKVHANEINAGNGNATVRLTINPDKTKLNIGDTIQADATLFRPAPLYEPEGFNWARWMYFNNLSATGFINNVKVIKNNGGNTIPVIRDRIHLQTNSFLVDSLVLGYKSAAPHADNPIWTATGVGHVWSISGFHMTLVGGWLGFLFYMIFRSIPYITRRIPAKIPALACAWVGLLFYLFLSGIDVATIRSFLMATLIIIAFAFGRSAICLRNVALAFCVLFLMNPHYVMQAGFQLSFMAVLGLVWMYNVVKPRTPQNKILKVIYACVLTSVVATLFTAPFVATHFGAIPVYGLIGNLVFLPVFSFVIMPLVLIGVFTAPLGIHAPIKCAHWCYELILGWAKHIADWPYATITTPIIPNTAIVCATIGFMCLTLIRNEKVKLNIILFVVFCGLGVFCVTNVKKPVFMATPDAELVAGVNADGKLEFSKEKSSTHYFAFRTWKEMNGENPDTPTIRRKPEKGLFLFNDIAYMQRFKPIMNNIENLCNDDRIRYIVTYLDIKSKKCKHKLLRGGMIIYQDYTIKYLPINRRWN